MRTVVAVCTLALLALWVSQPLAQKADTRAIKAAVAGYVGKKADADSKRVSLEVLSTAPHVEICKALKGSLRKDAERDAALELALKLNLRGFFADAEKQIAKSASGVAALGLISNDKGAIKALVDHWVKAEADSDTFRGLKQAFTTYGVALADLEPFRTAAFNEDQPEPKREAALEVMAFQLGVAVPTAEELERQWDAATGELKEQARRHAMSGIDAFALPGWELKNARRLGVNYLLPESAAVLRPTPFAANMNEPSYVLTVQVLPKEGFKGSVGLLVEQLEGNALLGVRAEEGKWVFKTTEGSFEALLIPNEWQSITWTVTGTLSAKSCAIKVGDKVIAQNLGLQGKLVGMEFFSESAGCAVGGLDYLRTVGE